MAHLYKNTCMSDRREGSVEAAIAVDFVFRLKDNFKPLPNKPWSLRVCHTSLLKTLWEKEKLLVTSNLSFSHSVFYLFKELSVKFNKFEIVVCKLFEFGGVENLSFGKGLSIDKGQYSGQNAICTRLICVETVCFWSM